MDNSKYSFFARLVDTFPLCNEDDHIQSNCLKLMNSTLQFIRTNKSDISNAPIVTIPTEMLLDALRLSLHGPSKSVNRVSKEKKVPPTKPKKQKKVTIRSPEVSSVVSIPRVSKSESHHDDSISESSTSQSYSKIPPDESITDIFASASFGNVTLLDKYGQTVASFFGNI